MKLISVTRLRLRSIRYVPAFIWIAWSSARQAKRATGNIGIQIVRDAHLTFWTLTAWESEAEMRAFMLTGAHHRAMPKLLNWCDEASVVHWYQDNADLPSLAEAHRRLLTEGRATKLRYPSASQRDHQIAEPSSF
ncbi:MAG: DUF3291 domain-containing protein [Elainella sp.]